ncbi:unnamed protein product [Aphis gossypii]|uniref:Uncharacterized protein n=1 Tax=Aphis gossypii TaxID=80765 RepID=A0A9P0JB19_APHGO|nr:unnamed protein product [Aphis gossypii]
MILLLLYRTSCVFESPSRLSRGKPYRRLRPAPRRHRGYLHGPRTLRSRSPSRSVTICPRSPLLLLLLFLFLLLLLYYYYYYFLRRRRVVYCSWRSGRSALHPSWPEYSRSLIYSPPTAYQKRDRFSRPSPTPPATILKIVYDGKKSIEHALFIFFVPFSFFFHCVPV